MTDLEVLLNGLGAQVRTAGGGPPAADPETLAETGEPASQWTLLFSPEASPGEDEWAPSPEARQAVRDLIKPSPLAAAWRLSLRLVDEALEILDHTGELLSPAPLAVRAAASPVLGRRSHTFRHPLPPYGASLGLEAEGEERFGLTLTLDNGAESAPDVRVTLWQGDRRRAVRSGKGDIYLSGLKVGRYRVEVSADGEALGSIDLLVDGGRLRG